MKDQPRSGGRIGIRGTARTLWKMLQKAAKVLSARRQPDPEADRFMHRVCYYLD